MIGGASIVVDSVEKELGSKSSTDSGRPEISVGKGGT